MLLRQRDVDRQRGNVQHHLPASQRAVITLRDVEGYAAAEVCNILAIAETNQRVLLHRARAKVRNVLEKYFNEG